MSPGWTSGETLAAQLKVQWKNPKEVDLKVS